MPPIDHNNNKRKNNNINNIDFSYIYLKNEYIIEKYLEIINSKTAVLFSASTEVAGIINLGSYEEIDSLKIFGKNLGIIFQIVDDILDYIGDENSIGKQLGDDFFEGKITLPIIITIIEANKINNSQDVALIKEIFLNKIDVGCIFLNS